MATVGSSFGFESTDFPTDTGNNDTEEETPVLRLERFAPCPIVDFRGGNVGKKMRKLLRIDNSNNNNTAAVTFHASKYVFHVLFFFFFFFCSLIDPSLTSPTLPILFLPLHAALLNTHLKILLRRLHSFHQLSLLSIALPDPPALHGSIL